MKLPTAIRPSNRRLRCVIILQFKAKMLFCKPLFHEKITQPAWQQNGAGILPRNVHYRQYQSARLQSQEHLEH